MTAAPTTGLIAVGSCSGLGPWPVGISEVVGIRKLLVGGAAVVAGVLKVVVVDGLCGGGGAVAVEVACDGCAVVDVIAGVVGKAAVVWMAVGGMICGASELGGRVDGAAEVDPVRSAGATGRWSGRISLIASSAAPNRTISRAAATARRTARRIESARGSSSASSPPVATTPVCPSAKNLRDRVARPPRKARRLGAPPETRAMWRCAATAAE